MFAHLPLNLSQIAVEEDTASPVTLGEEEVVDLVLDTFAENMAVICPSRVYALRVDVNSDGKQRAILPRTSSQALRSSNVDAPASSRQV